MKVSQNVSQKALILIFMGLDVYRILIGSFFGVFVPQRCDVKTVSNSTIIESSHTC
jgi:hypothetical protein